jgi:site-specific DNA-cytosine methylase
MKVLVACEFSGIVRDAFRRRGHEAYSCDLLPCEGDQYFHAQGDVLALLRGTWDKTRSSGKWFSEDIDLMIAHPPCTHLAVSGARWFKDKKKEQKVALEFVRALLDAPIPRIALENPISIISSKIRKPDQIIQPWMFGHGETKATCLWLKGLPKLVPTNVVSGRENRVWKMPPSENRWKERSRTFKGIADAMADQWGNFMEEVAKGKVADARRWGSPESPKFVGPDYPKAQGFRT